MCLDSKEEVQLGISRKSVEERKIYIALEKGIDSLQEEQLSSSNLRLCMFPSSPLRLCISLLTQASYVIRLSQFRL